jgi:indole-3-glycerol phosphate synthase
MSTPETVTLPLPELLEIKSASPWPVSDNTGSFEQHSLAAALMASGPIAIVGECRSLAPTYGNPARHTPEELIEFYSGRVDAINVLTEGLQFGGSLDWLAMAKEKSELPVICLDLVGSDEAVQSARSFGADTIILIAGLLERKKLIALSETAKDCGLETIIETQSVDEAEQALEARADIIGINTRNLANLSEINLDLPEQIIGTLPAGTLTIVESGIRTPDDLKRYIGLADAALIGSAFVESDDMARTFAMFDSVR